MSNEFFLSDQDVVSMAVDKNFAKTTTSTVTELKQGMIRQCLGDALSTWVTAGVNCQILLESGGGWQKGKIRLRLEFIPDNPPPPKPSGCCSTNSQLGDFRSDVGI